MTRTVALALCLLASPTGAVGPVVPISNLPRADAEGFPLPTEAVARLGSARFLPAGYVYATAWTPDGRHLITLSGKILQVGDVRTGMPVASVPLPVSLYNGMHLGVSADGRTVTVAGQKTNQRFVTISVDWPTGRVDTPVECGTGYVYASRLSA